jgi:hypothetical protein
VLSVGLAAPATAVAECAGDIIGKWQQSHVEFAGNRINDDSQSWEFMTNDKVRFLKSSPEIDVSGDYSCEGDIIYMKGSSPGRLKIVTYDGDRMAWESLDHGGGITHVVRVK